MTNYVPLPYSYNGGAGGEYHQHHQAPHHSNDQSVNSPPVLPVSPPLQQGLMSISQPETPRPEQSTLSPSSSSSSTTAGGAGGNDKLAISPNLIRRRPPTIPSRPANFTTTTFHSNPYPSSGPIRRRRTESIFSFEMGPAFTSTKQLHDLCNMDQSNSYQVQLHAKMDRGFFRADQDWTCYRRNYFQVSSTFDVHGMNYLIQGPEVPCLLRKTDTQEYHQVDYFSIGVCARVTNHDKKIELVQHTPKRDKGPQLIPEPRPLHAGGNLHLASVGSNHNIVTFERLQFKTATANNGKRRAAQQYYEIVVDLYANFQRGEPIRVATCTSAPLVVRGRSPGHYADSHTRFKHMDTDSSISNELSSTDSAAAGGVPPPPPPSSTAATLASSNGDQSGSPTNPRFNASLPNSPINDFSPYSSYNGYTYSSLNGYPPMMPPSHPSSSGLSQYPPTNAPSHNGQVPGPYFPNNQAHHQPPPSHIYDNTPPGPYDDKMMKTEPKPNGYWGNGPSTAYNNGHHNNNNNMYNMNSAATNNPYGRPQHHHEEGPYSSAAAAGLDAGRPQ